MNTRVLDTDDRKNALDKFAARPAEVESTSIVPAGVFAGPAERVFGAQPVAVRRDEGEILHKLKVMAAAAGEDWFYRFPVKKKVKNEKTGADEWVTDYIEGPSIKCANNVSRLYGNCDIDTRAFDTGTHYMFYARFMDLETGYSLVRPFQQRKGQKALRGDAGRQEDIVFQIGASKAIRNVINNALEFFTNFAADEAKNSIIEKVGKRLEFYRDRVKVRLEEMGIELKSVEAVRGRVVSEWLAPDVARTIAELQAIQDGMATAAETYTPSGEVEHDPQTGEIKQQKSEAQGGESQAGATEAGASVTETETVEQTGASANSNTEASQQQGSTSDSNKPADAGQPASEKADSPKGGKKEAGAAGAKPGDAEQVVPTTEKEYEAHANGWIDELTASADGEARWKAEKTVRNKANVSEEVREALKSKLDKKVAELKAVGK